MHNRRHGRVRARGVASHLREGAQLFTGLAVENLSRGGAFIRCSTPMPIGSAVMLDLVRPGLKRALQLTGRVVSLVDAEAAHRRGGVPGMGIQFDAYGAGVAERLNELLVALGAGPDVLRADPPGPAAQVTAPMPAPALDAAPTQQLPAPPTFQLQHSVPVPESTRLMVQVKGLLMELGDWQQRVSALERENEQLREEIARLRSEPGRKDR